jgi:gluconolactonase
MRISIGAVVCLFILLERLPAAEEIFAPGATLKVEAEGGVGGEGPAWHPKLGVLTSGNGHVNQLDPAGRSRIYRKNAGTNGLLFDRQGRLLACDSEQRRMIRLEDDGKLTVLTDRFQGKRYNTPNDLTLDSRDRLYFSDPRYGDRKGMEITDEQGRTVEGVYRLDPDGKVARVIGREVERANGVLVSPDDRYLYVADNNNDTRGGARKLWRFALRKDGTVDLASKKLLYDWPGRPETGSGGPALRGRGPEQAQPAIRTCRRRERGHLRAEPRGQTARLPGRAARRSDQLRLRGHRLQDTLRHRGRHALQHPHDHGGKTCLALQVAARTHQLPKGSGRQIPPAGRHAGMRSLLLRYPEQLQSVE